MAGDPVLAQLAFLPARTVAAGQTPPGGAVAPGTPAQLQLTLRTLAGVAVAGAQVLLQARTVGRRGLQVGREQRGRRRPDATGQCTIDGRLRRGCPRGAARARALRRRVRPRSGRLAGRPRAGAAGLTLADSDRAQPPELLRLAAVSPLWGSVWTSSVGARRARAHSRHAVVEGVVEPGQRPSAAREHRWPRASSGRWPRPTERSKLQVGGSPAGSPSSRGRCSSAFSSQPLAQTRLVTAPRRSSR